MMKSGVKVSVKQIKAKNGQINSAQNEIRNSANLVRSVGGGKDGAKVSNKVDKVCRESDGATKGEVRRKLAIVPGDRMSGRRL
jgi:hypothetical protein